MTKAEHALDLVIGIGCGVVGYYMAAQGAWKRVRRHARGLLRKS